MSYRDFFQSIVQGLSIHQNGRQAYGHCPLHEDKIKSFSVNLLTSQWYCHSSCGAGNATTICRRLGIPLPSQDESSGPPTYPRVSAAPAAGVEKRVDPAAIISKRVANEYVYRDEQGQPLYKVVRMEPKGFFQKRWESGQWISGLGETRRVLYNLPEVIAATSFIILVEGEKDADRLMDLGFVATTSPMGAGKWSDDYAAFLRSKRVVIIPDNDEPGELHAQTAARSIIAASGSCKLLRLPGLPPKGDASDFLDRGNDKDSLVALIKATPIFGQVSHSTELPLEYFKRVGLEINDGALRLPGEFKALCKETYGAFTSIAKNVTTAVEEQIALAETVWQACRTRGQYEQFLRILKKAHELSMAESL